MRRTIRIDDVHANMHKMHVFMSIQHLPRVKAACIILYNIIYSIAAFGLTRELTALSIEGIFADSISEKRGHFG